MKTILFALRLALCAGLFLGSQSAEAALRYYRATWSGTAFGNSAQAIAFVTIDDALLLNPGDNGKPFSDPNRALRDILITVSGATVGNGTFTRNDFSSFSLTISSALDLDQPWFGQPQTTLPHPSLWGQFGSSHDFNLSSLTPNAPTANFFSYIMKTSSGTGDSIEMISFDPLDFEPNFPLLVGAPVANVPDAIIAGLTPSEITPEKDLLVRAKLKGNGITATNDSCLLKWDHAVVTSLVREGDLLSGIRIAAFGDPVFESGKLFFPATLTISPVDEVTKTNNQVIATVNADGTGGQIIARKGSPAVGLTDCTLYSFVWLHPTTNGLYFGATALNSVDLTKKMGVWHWDGTNTTLVTAIGRQMPVGFEIHTIKTINKPGASGPVTWQTRVGNSSAISLLIKTVEGATFLHVFE